jgi:hypothetical protein
MRIRVLYVLDAILGLGWGILPIHGYSPTFPWWSILLLLGSLLLAGCSVRKRSYEKYRGKWPPMVGTGLLAVYFVSGVVVTLRGYVRGTVIASVAQLGFVLALVTLVVVCFAVALWDVLRVKDERFSRA